MQFQAHNGNASLSKPGLGHRAEDMPGEQAEELALQVKALEAANKVTAMGFVHAQRCNS